MSIGTRIKERRIELGYSAEKLGQLIGKNRATIYRYENNEIENLPTTILEPLAKALKTTPAYLMGWEDEEPELDDEMVVLARGAKTLTKEQKQLIKNMIDEFNKNNED